MNQKTDLIKSNFGLLGIEETSCLCQLALYPTCCVRCSLSSLNHKPQHEACIPLFEEYMRYLPQINHRIPQTETQGKETMLTARKISVGDNSSSRFLAFSQLPTEAVQTSPDALEPCAQISLAVKPNLPTKHLLQI